MTTPHPALFDPGLQPERTQLAWRRTVAAVTVAAVVSLRVLPPVLGAWSAAAGALGVVAGAALWVAARRRATTVDRVLRTPGSTLPGGGLPLVLAVVVTGGAALAVLAVASGLRL